MAIQRGKYLNFIRNPTVWRCALALEKTGLHKNKEKAVQCTCFSAFIYSTHSYLCAAKKIVKLLYIDQSKKSQNRQTLLIRGIIELENYW